MSLNITLRTAASGLLAAQMGLRAVSDNVANVNTPGYVRKTVDQRPLVVNGTGMGVEVTGIKRVTDQYLQLASLTAGSDNSRWDAFSQYMDSAQGLFGDPSSDSYFFSRIDDIYSGFAAAANDPSNGLLRSQATAAVQGFLGDAQRINGQLSDLSNTVDTRIGSDVTRANDLLTQINSLNSDITRARLVDQDASGAENIQTQLVDELTSLMSVQVNQRQNGGVDIRSNDGVQLAGDGVMKLVYNQSDLSKGYISAVPPDGVGPTQTIVVNGGEVRGLLDLRNDKLPTLTNQLGEFVQRTTEQLNAAHNDSSTFPAPTSLTGRQTGLDIGAAASGFTGQSTVAIVNAAGVVQKQVDIDFTNSTFTVDGVPAGSFSPASFDSDLTAALGGLGTASFTNGVLSISATGAGNGVAIDEGTSQKAGRGFSHFFGLNDLVRSAGPGTYDTGLSATDAHGFTPGDQITFRLAQPDGRPIRDVVVSVPPGGTMQDLVDALNDNTTGVGLYGKFTLDKNGGLTFGGAPPYNASLSVLKDNTQRGGAGGMSMSQLFGLGARDRAGRANQYTVSPAIASDPSKMAFAQLDLSAAPGTPALRPGDGSGALAMSTAGDVTTQFQAAGSLGAVAMTVSRYASEFSGSIGRDAADAQTRKDASAAVKSEADARRQSVEGVNLDEELVRLTTYQQAFNASARMIQAAKELFDVLTNMV